MKLNPKYEPMFSFGTKKEEIAFHSQMISYRILSVVETVCTEKNIRKKDLAALVGTSRSYITQLFRGTKQVNTVMMARFEDALGFSFEVNYKMDTESSQASWKKQSSSFFQPNGCFQTEAGITSYIDPSNKDIPSITINDVITK